MRLRGWCVGVMALNAQQEMRTELNVALVRVGVMQCDKSKMVRVRMQCRRCTQEDLTLNHPHVWIGSFHSLNAICLSLEM